MGFKVNDRVHFKMEFDGKITYYNGDNSFDIEYERDGETHLVEFVAAKNISLLDPASWPPKIGDVWEADGHDYFVYAGVCGLTVFPSENTFLTKLDSYSGTELDKFKKLNPALARRSDK